VPDLEAAGYTLTIREPGGAWPSIAKTSRRSAAATSTPVSTWTHRGIDHAHRRHRLFATFSGFLANAFLSPRTPIPVETTPELAELLTLVDRQEETTAQLRAKLEQLEAAGSRTRLRRSTAAARVRAWPRLG